MYFLLVVTLFFSFLSQSSFSDGKFGSFQLYLFIKYLIFVIFSEFFPILLWFNATVTAIDSVYRKDENACPKVFLEKKYFIEERNILY